MREGRNFCSGTWPASNASTVEPQGSVADGVLVWVASLPGSCIPAALRGTRKRKAVSLSL